MFEVCIFLQVVFINNESSKNIKIFFIHFE
jgi:hypothetical protein